MLVLLRNKTVHPYTIMPETALSELVTSEFGNISKIFWLVSESTCSTFVFESVKTWARWLFKARQIFDRFLLAKINDRRFAFFRLGRDFDRSRFIWWFDFGYDVSLEMIFKWLWLKMVIWPQNERNTRVICLYNRMPWHHIFARYLFSYGSVGSGPTFVVKLPNRHRFRSFRKNHTTLKFELIVEKNGDFSQQSL